MAVERYAGDLRALSRSAAPNIVPADTSALYYERAPDVESLHRLETRGRACFEAGASAIGCTHEVTQVSPVYTDPVPDLWLAAAYRLAITGLGRTSVAAEVERDRHTSSPALALTGLAAATDDTQRERLIGAQRERLVGRVPRCGAVPTTVAGGAL